MLKSEHYQILGALGVLTALTTIQIQIARDDRRNPGIYWCG